MDSGYDLDLPYYAELLPISVCVCVCVYVCVFVLCKFELEICGDSMAIAHNLKRLCKY